MINKKQIKEILDNNYLLRDYFSINFSEMRDSMETKSFSCYISYKSRVIEIDFLYNKKDKITKVYWSVEGYIYMLTADYINKLVSEMELKANDTIIK